MQHRALSRVLSGQVRLITDEEISQISGGSDEKPVEGPPGHWHCASGAQVSNAFYTGDGVGAPQDCGN